MSQTHKPPGHVHSCCPPAALRNPTDNMERGGGEKGGAERGGEEKMKGDGRRRERDEREGEERRGGYGV